MGNTSFSGNIKGRNIAIGQGSKIEEVHLSNLRDDSRVKINEQLDRIDQMITECGEQLKNAKALKQEVSVIKDRLNKKEIDKNSISIKLNNIEASVKSVANIVTALNTIKAILNII